MIKNFDKYHHLLNLHFIVVVVVVVFCFLVCFFLMIKIQVCWIERLFNLTNKIFSKKNWYSDGIIAWEIRPFSTPFFNHFTQLSPPPITKLKSLHDVFSDQSSDKHYTILLWFAPHMMTLNFSLKLYAPPSFINMTTLIRHHTKFTHTPSFSQENLFTRQFNTSWPTLDHYQGAASLNHFNHHFWYLFDPIVTGSLVMRLGLKTQPSM